MKQAVLLVTVAVALALASCQSPVTNPQSVTSSGGSLPLGQGSGVTVYAATADGNGVLEYSGTATNWVSLNWSNFYSASNPYYYSASSNTTMVYPPVYDVTVNGGTVYAATAAGLFVGSGSSWARYQQGLTLTGVSVSGNNVYLWGPVQTASSFYGLGLLSTANLGTAPTPLVDSTHAANVTKWAALPSGYVAATSLGLYYSATASGSYTLAGYTGTALNAGAVNTVYAPGSTLYVGTLLGFSTTSTTTPFSWTNNPGLGNVNDILVVGSTIYLATTTGLTSYGNWQFSGVGVNNIVEGITSSTFYFSNGSAGLAILQFDSSGNPYSTSVLTWANVSKVFVTFP